MKEYERILELKERITEAKLKEKKISSVSLIAERTLSPWLVATYEDGKVESYKTIDEMEKFLKTF